MKCVCGQHALSLRKPGVTVPIGTLCGVKLRYSDPIRVPVVVWVVLGIVLLCWGRCACEEAITMMCVWLEVLSVGTVVCVRWKG